MGLGLESSRARVYQVVVKNAAREKKYDRCNMSFGCMWTETGDCCGGGEVGDPLIYGIQKSQLRM